MSEESTNPFSDWDVIHSTLENETWRKRHEAEILEAIRIKRSLDKVRHLLTRDIFEFCDECEEMKCYGSLYPICEFTLNRLLNAINECKNKSG